MAKSIGDKALADLQWSQIVSAVAARLEGPSGASFELPLASSPEAMSRALTETEEALRAMQEGDPLPLVGLKDVGEQLMRLERHGQLDAPALSEVRSVLSAARVLRRYLGRRRDELPALGQACAFDPSLDGLLETLDIALDRDGGLADHASAELRKLRTETHNLRARLISKLEALLAEKADLLSDSYYTEREGRHVVPVRADAHERVHGIVHGTSASGSTIFVEPRACVEAGNRLKLAQAEQVREEARILAELCERVREQLPSVQSGYAALRHADMRSACAGLAKDTDAVRPEVTPEPRMRIVAGRHPILLLDGVDVVPNDIELSAGRGLIISGPNAGGKTVALKLLGLSALMSRAGLFVPADAGTCCGFFSQVLSDVGDEQSLTRNLSTFSAHVKNLCSILDVADGQSLVLLDELAGSTDPEEGAALACAILERLCTAGAAVALTTHYEPLKALAIGDTRLENASVGFDVQQMAPTFRLRMGVPGSSSALSVAARFGISASVIERAREVLPEQARSFEALVNRLEAEAERLRTEREQAESANESAQAALARAQLLEEAQNTRDKKALRQENEALMEELRQARTEVAKARKVLRRRKLDEQQLLSTRSEVDALSKRAAETKADLQQAPSSDTRNGVDEATLAPGSTVFVPRLRADATVVEGPKRGQVRVSAGALRLWIDVTDLRASASSASSKNASPPNARAALPEPKRRAPIQSPDNTVDVRGMVVEDAESMVEGFLDELFGRDEPVAFVLHGLGSGALRDGLRRWLAADSTYVESFRPGSREEGGDRFTVVNLR